MYASSRSPLVEAAPTLDDGSKDSAGAVIPPLQPLSSDCGALDALLSMLVLSVPAVCAIPRRLSNFAKA